MKISKSSWHYRFVMYPVTLLGWDWGTPSNLCAYVRRLFGTTLLTFLFVLIAVGMVLDVYLYMFLPDELAEGVSKIDWLMSSLGLEGTLMMLLLVAAVIPGALAWCFVAFALAIVAIFGTGFGVYSLTQMRKESLEAQGKATLTHVMVEWYKAKKEKYCPVVTYEE